MIVSLLQLMGFPMAKTVHSRAEESSLGLPAKGRKGSVASATHLQTSPDRRQEVKSKSGKAIVTKTGQPVVKPSTKSAAKAAPKSSVKPDVKPTQPAPKAASSKPVKPTTKVVVKPPAKVAEKSSAKAVPKVAPKPAAKAQPISAPKPADKPTAKTVSMPPVVSSPPAKPKAVTVTVAPPVAPAPAKAGRPSSRLAQVTVPSMAQTTASTAAKSSYSQSTPAAVIVPMLPSAVKKDAKLVNNWKTTPPEQLTDAELIAMPDAEYMNDVQMAAFKVRLLKLKADILASAGETTEHLREDSSVTPDPADRATIEEEHALELRTRDRERKLLKKIEQSIVRIDAGDYGYCDETGEPIGVGRLLARPTATLSLEAQQRRELKQKMFGD
ncbi:MAG: RNA polymerase-binding protein DksA [Burkholderiales bacterium PBB4]|nr:MAG: RNA polymerase-binding protein DksA [Burkholderiales bacterium PBB4]